MPLWTRRRALAAAAAFAAAAVTLHYLTRPPVTVWAARESRDAAWAWYVTETVGEADWNTGRWAPYFPPQRAGELHLHPGAVTTRGLWARLRERLGHARRCPGDCVTLTSTGEFRDAGGLVYERFER